MSEIYPSTHDEVFQAISKILQIAGALRNVGDDRAEGDRYRNAIAAYDEALRKTVQYVEDIETRKHSYDIKKESELARLWSNASIAINEFDASLANRCFIKGQGWLKPSVWKDSRYEKYKIGIDDMRQAIIDLNDSRHEDRSQAKKVLGREEFKHELGASGSMILNALTALLERAVAKLPRMKLAWGVVGIATAAAIINLILGLNRLALSSGSFVFIGMVLLFAFGRVPAGDRISRIAGQVTIAVVAGGFALFIASAFLAAYNCKPPGFVYLFGLETICRNENPTKGLRVVSTQLLDEQFSEVLPGKNGNRPLHALTRIEERSGNNFQVNRPDDFFFALGFVIKGLSTPTDDGVKALLEIIFLSRSGEVRRETASLNRDTWKSFHIAKRLGSDIVLRHFRIRESDGIPIAVIFECFDQQALDSWDGRLLIRVRDENAGQEATEPFRVSLEKRTVPQQLACESK